MLGNELTSLETQLRIICETYNKINVTYKYETVIHNLKTYLTIEKV